MDKKDVCILLGIGALATGAYSAYRQYKQEKCLSKLNKKISRLGTCHNNFVRSQEVCNIKATENAEYMDERIAGLESAYLNHIMDDHKECSSNNDIVNLSVDEYIKDYNDNAEEQD